MVHRHLEYFKTVSEMRSVSAAAKKLNISQPSLSRSISILEEQLHVPLFIRKSRGVELTDYGEALYRHVCFMMQEFKYAQTELENIKTRSNHTLRIGAGLLWQFRYLPPVMQLYKKEDPNVRFEIVGDYAHNLFNDFLGGQYDVILCDLDGVPRKSGLIFEKIISVNFTLFARADHPIFNENHENIEKSLEDYEFAVYKHSEQEFLTSIQDIRRYNAIEEHQIKLVTTSIVNLFETLIQSNLIASLPQQLSPYARLYNVAELSPTLRCSPFASGAVYRAASNHKQYIQRFITLLRNECLTKN